MFCCKSKQLTQQTETLLIHSSGCLKNHRSKLKRCPFEAFIVVGMLLRCSVTLAWCFARQIVRVKGAGNCDVDGKAFVGPPDWYRDISWSTAIDIPKDSFL